MGMNIHFHSYPEDAPALRDFPSEMHMDNSYTCPRWYQSSDFMRALYDNSEIVQLCPDHENHSYCSGETIYRPIDFAKLREATKDLQPIFQVIIDYLESEPNAWLEYD